MAATEEILGQFLGDQTFPVAWDSESEKDLFWVYDDLHIPHLLMHERAFVLRPLADLAPELEHPVLYQTIRQLLEELADEHEVHPSDLPRRWFDF